MNYKLLLFAAMCFFLVFCASQEEQKLGEIESGIAGYLSKSPTLLTSNKVPKEGEEIYAYYALKVIKYNISYDMRRTSPSQSHEGVTVEISFKALDNSKSGDLISYMSQFQTELDIEFRESSGFSTTHMALANTDFTSERNGSIMIRYIYRDGNWIYDGMSGGALPQSFINDLETFPQNKEFREAIGMSS